MAAVMFERPPLSKGQLASLRAYIIKKRRRERESENPASESKKKLKMESEEATHQEPVTMEEEHASTKVNRKSPPPPLETVKDTKEQLQSLKDKLELLKKEKHSLFQELKKVLHEEEEKRKQKEQEQQLHHMMASSEYNRDTKTGGHVPLGGSGGMIRSSWGAVPHHEAQQQPSSKLDPSMLRYQTHFSPRGAQMTGGTGYRHYSHQSAPMSGRHVIPQVNLSSDLYHSKDSHSSYNHYYSPSGVTSSHFRTGSYQQTTGSGQFFGSLMQSSHDSVHMYHTSNPSTSNALHSHPHTQYEMIPGRGGVGGGGEYNNQFPYDPRQQRYHMLPMSPQATLLKQQQHNATGKK